MCKVMNNEVLIFLKMFVNVFPSWANTTSKEQGPESHSMQVMTNSTN